MGLNSDVKSVPLVYVCGLTIIKFLCILDGIVSPESCIFCAGRPIWEAVRCTLFALVGRENILVVRVDACTSK